MVIVFGAAALLYLVIALWHPLAASAATITVTTASDDVTPSDGTVSLREAIAAINAGSNLGDPDIIAQNPGTFAASDAINFSGISGPIALTNDGTHGTLNLTKSVAFTGPGITVDGGSAFSVFVVNEGVTASINGLNIINGGGSGGGGGVRNNGKLTLTNLSLTSSTSDGGGGVLNNVGGVLTVTNCTFANNGAPDLGGGAIFNGGSATITNSSFAQNTAGFGGAIGNSGTLIVTGSAFIGNTSATVSIGSGEGGAINNGKSAQVTNSTFSNNSASAKGGGIYNDLTLQTTNVTVSGNQATTSGGGIYSAGAATLTNTLVAGNTGGDLSTGTVNPTGTFTGNTNLIADSTANLLTGTGNLNTPALLDPNGAQFNGGLTQTVALLPGSPAIGGGTPTGAGIPTTDQRNAPRTGHNDIGAFQSQGFTLTLTVGTTPQSTLVNTPFTNPLGVAVTSPSNDPVIGGTVTFTLPAGAGIPSGAFGAPGACTVSGDNLTATCPITGSGPVALCAAPSGPHRTGCGTPSGTSTSPTVTANGTAGSYNANATTNGAPPAAPFVLTNQVVACVVNSTQDPTETGKMTLRDAVTVANSGACTNNNTITFDGGTFPPSVSATIALTQGEFVLTYTGGPTTIDGTGHMVIVDGGGMTTIFLVFQPDVTVTLNTLKMQNGFNFEGGGAIVNAGTFTVANSVLDHNNGGVGAGGAIENLNTLTVTNSTFTNNSASDGGAIDTVVGIDTNVGMLTVTGSTFVGNTAVQPSPSRVPHSSSPSSPKRPIRPADGFTSAGGAIFICSCTSAKITNSTFSGNTAVSAGGAILDEGGLTLTNVTISGNSANNGGGILVDGGSGGTLIATNALIAGNTLSGTGGAGPDVNGPVNPASANNLIGVGDGSTGLMNGTNRNLIGTSAAPIATLLGALGNYGGGTQTIPLLPGSPAIDAGTSTGAPATDQRGKPRVGAPDIGAFESQGFALAIVSGTPQTKQINTAFAPLVGSVTSATEPVVGGVLTFTGPASGAGIQASPVTVTIAASGQASITPAANATVGGPYAVVAATRGAIPPSVSFQLTNAAVPVPTLIVSGPAHLKVGETEQYTATQTFVTGSAQPPAGVVWKSSDETIATMSADGKLTALRPGSVTITATANGLTGSLPVQVDPVVLTGVQPDPLPPRRTSGAAANPGATVPAPAPAPPSR